jgi:ferric-dicitrate binding protein FerR (iron transport regulator)
MSENQNFDDLTSSLEERIKDPVFLQEHMDAYQRAGTETREAYEELLKRIQPLRSRRINPLYYYASGVAALILLAVSGYFLLHAGRQTSPLIFSSAKGQQSHIALPDGSQVWLNAGSKLTYLARKATLDGEAFFDIAPDKTHPFHLSAGGTETEVLGTSFDVKAYQDETTVSITLIQGSVRVNFSNKNMTLQPGETVLAQAGTLTKLTSPDTASALAWKEGFFYFKGTLDEVARELAHWYDIDVTLQKGAVFKETFQEVAPRDLPLDSVLHRLEDIGAGHFKLEGRTLTVMP